jgi:hypothetical protein
MENNVIDAEFIENPENLPATVSVDLQEIDVTPIETDFAYARNNIINVIETSMKVLESVGQLAKDSDNPSCVDAYIQMVHTLSELNKDLFNVREKKMKLTGEIEDKPSPGSGGPRKVVNNAIFVGSTDELLKQMSFDKKIEIR